MTDSQSLFETLRVWTLQHLDALDDDVVDADGEGVLNSLRMIVTGEHGCTERDDYSDGQWAVLRAADLAQRAAVGRFPGPVPVVDGQPGSAPSNCEGRAPDGTSEPS